MQKYGPTLHSAAPLQSYWNLNCRHASSGRSQICKWPLYHAGAAGNKCIFPTSISSKNRGSEIKHRYDWGKFLPKSFHGKIAFTAHGLLSTKHFETLVRFVLIV